MSFSGYSKYVETTFEWIGSIPSHWDIKPIKFLAECLDGLRIPLNGEQRHERQGKIPYWGANSIMDHIDAFLLDERLILLGEDGAPFFESNRDVAFVSDGPIWPNNHIHVLRPERPEWCSHIVRCLNSTQFIDFVEGSTRLKLTQRRMSTIPIAWPPQDEQKAINEFLDHETAKIDALVAEQKRLIELLKEKRQAVISHAVTKGLDPNVPMKDSGVDWLGEIPASWRISRVKHITDSIDQGWSPQCDAQSADLDSEQGVLKVGCVNGGRFNPAENKKLPDGLNIKSNLAIRIDDLLISRANTKELVGSAAVANESYANLLLCDKLYRLRLKSAECNPRYLAQFLGIDLTRYNIQVEATGASSSMQNIGQSTILELPLPLPPFEEQNELLSTVRSTTENLREMTTEARTSIDILAERRSALISAAVTGKIDVRDWKPPRLTETISREATETI